MAGRVASGKPAGRPGAVARAIRVAALCLAVAPLVLSMTTGALMNYPPVLLMASTGIAVLTPIVSAARGNVQRIGSEAGTVRPRLARGALGTGIGRARRGRRSRGSGTSCWAATPR